MSVPGTNVICSNYKTFESTTIEKTLCMERRRWTTQLVDIDDQAKAVGVPPKSHKTRKRKGHRRPDYRLGCLRVEVHNLCIV
uniref:Uncharacterized protein n=1 Tax=Panagrellus redivivus TaxID=6233 RepID=A0A7E4VPX3_PANRE